MKKTILASLTLLSALCLQAGPASAQDFLVKKIYHGKNGKIALLKLHLGLFDSNGRLVARADENFDPSDFVFEVSDAEGNVLGTLRSTLSKSWDRNACVDFDVSADEEDPRVGVLTYELRKLVSAKVQKDCDNFNGAYDPVEEMRKLKEFIARGGSGGPN
jgi:hypothetical protein